MGWTDVDILPGYSYVHDSGGDTSITFTTTDANTK